MGAKKKQRLRESDACHVVRDYIHHFANPVRLRIMCELTLGERNVGELVEAAGVRQPSVSQQLNLLRLAGLVDRTRAGGRSVYRIADPLAKEMMEFLFSLAEKLLVRQDAATAATEGECICA